MTLDELRTHLLALTPAEKAEVVHLLLQSLGNIWPGIEKTPGVVGGDACIVGTRIPMWDLVQYRRLGASDAKILEAYPQLTATHLAQRVFEKGCPRSDLPPRDSKNADFWGH